MSLESNQGINDLEALIARNDTKLPDEQKRINNEPQGDWQSPSDGQRWADLHRELEKTRLETNINNSKNRLEEREFIENMVNVTIPALISRKMEAIKTESRGKSIYTSLTGLANTTKINNKKMNKDIENLENLSSKAQKQLEYYDLNYAPRKDYLALSEGYPNAKNYEEISPQNPQIPRYLFNSEVQKGISEMMGPKGGKSRKYKRRKSKKSKKSRKSRK